MSGRVAPLPDNGKIRIAKNALPPITSDRKASQSLDSIGGQNSHIGPDNQLHDDIDYHAAEYSLSSSSNFQMPSLSYPIEPYITQNHLDFDKLRKSNRIIFPLSTKKFLLPDEAERPVFYKSDSNFTKIASPYVQLIREEGILSMGLIDPLQSIPKLEGNPIFIPISQIMKDKPVNRSTVQEKFPVLNTSQLSTLLIYLARIGDLESVKYLCRTALINVNITDDSGRSPLVYAAIGGHTETMKVLLKSGAYVDAIDNGGRTALFHAAYYSMPGSIRVLLQHGANITHRDYFGKNVLHYSIFSDKVQSTRILLSALRRLRFLSLLKFQRPERLLDCFDDSGVTPVMWAAYLGQVGHLKAMVLLNFDSLKVKDKNGLSCIHFCANNTHLRVSKFLLSKNRNLVYDASNKGCRPVHLAARKGNYDLLELFLSIDKGLVNAVDLKKRTPLHYASGTNKLALIVAYGNIASIRILIENGADVDFKDDDGVTPLHYATMSNYLDCVQLLTKRGAIVEVDDKNGRSPIIWAFMLGNLEISKALMPLVTRPNHLFDSYKNTPLHIVALTGHIAAAIYLLQNGCDVDSKNDQGMTPIFHSVIMGWVDLTKELIDFGANISEQDNLGRTPLHWAIIAAANDVIQCLLDCADCFIAVPDYSGREPIHEAAAMGNDDLIKTFINMGCEPSCTDDNGLTPLHFCCERGDVTCCKTLLENSVPFNALDFSAKRKTPLDLAYDKQHKECIELLREAGCLTGDEIRILAARAIQFAWSNFKARKAIKQPTVYLHVHTGNNKERNIAATKIQAWFKGNIQRKKYKRKIALARIESMRLKELKFALEALEEAKKTREAAEMERIKAEKEFQEAEEARKKSMNAGNSDTKSTLISKRRQKFRARNTIINNTAATLIQRCWRSFYKKRKLDEILNCKNSQEMLLFPEAVRVADEKNSFCTSVENHKTRAALHRQNTGTKLNTLPKTAANAPQQNFESGNFNKVFKSTVTINGKERDPSWIKVDVAKRSDSPLLLTPTKGDRVVLKSMELGERLISNKGKRPSFDRGNSFKIYTGEPLVSSVIPDPTFSTSKRIQHNLERSSSTVTSSLNSSTFLTDVIPRGYDELNFHSIKRTATGKKI